MHVCVCVHVCLQERRSRDSCLLSVFIARDRYVEVAGQRRAKDDVSLGDAKMSGDREGSGSSGSGREAKDTLHT